jgi:hypothetical protein
MSVSQMLEALANQSPEVSKGIWDYQRLLNPGWKVEVFNPGTDTPNRRGQQVVDAFIDLLGQKYGSVDVVLGRMHMGAYMRGGYFAEIVLAENQRDAIDLATPDPASVRFKVIEDPVTKRQTFQLGQWQDKQFVPLDDAPGVSYIPIDPFPGVPYGRPMVAPAIFSALFLIGLLYDLRRVISQQGWPRIDIAVNTEKLLESLVQGEEASTPEEIEAVIGAAIRDVMTAYSQLQPDDAYVHSDEVEIKGPIGVTTGANLGGVEGIISVVERMLVRALKTTPLMLGITDGVSEANANRQWEMFIAGVKAMQHLAESMLQQFLQLLCQAQGVQAKVKWTFAEIRAAEEQRDALTESQKIDNAVKKYNQGWIDQDEAAMEITGHPPAEEEPRLTGALESASGAQANDENPDAGETKAGREPLTRLVEGQSVLRPSRIANRLAYRADMVRSGKIYVGTQTIAHGESTERYARPEEVWVPVGTRYYGRDNDVPVLDEYDVFVARVEQQ